MYNLYISPLLFSRNGDLQFYVFVLDGLLKVVS